MSRRWLLALPLAGLVLAGWWGLSGYAASQVDVTWESPNCRGTTVKMAGEIPQLAGGDSGYEQVIVAKPGMLCTIEVLVRNRGPLDVTLGQLVAPYMGPGAGAVLEGVGGEVADPVRHDIDLAYDVDSVVEAGSTLKFPLQVRYRDDGCTAAWQEFADWPLARVGVLGRQHDVASDRDLEFEHLTQNRGCGMDAQ